MAIVLPDSRWEAPELLIPGRKPVGNVKIDWSNPNSSLWKAINLLDGRDDRDMISGIQAPFLYRGGTAFNRQRLVTCGTYGSYLPYTNHITNSRLALPLNASGEKTNSVIIQGVIFVEGLSDVPIYHTNQSSIGGLLFRVGTNGLLQVLKSEISGVGVSPDHEPIRVGLPFTAGLVYVDASSTRVFLNGALVAAGSHAVSCVMTSSSVGPGFASTSDSTHYFIATFVAASDKVIPDRVMMSMTANPYQILIPA